MVDESTLPHRGDEINGYRASVSTGLKPRFWRFHLHDSSWRTAYLFLFIVTPLGLLPIWLGWTMLGSSGLKTKVLGIALCGVGGLMVLLGPLIALGMAWTAHACARTFRHGLLIPGVVHSSDPLEVVGLADLGKAEDRKGKEFGLARTGLWTLPNYSREVGTRVPCVADFSDEGPDRFYYFKPYPVCHGTGDEFDLEICMQKLGEAPFRRLEALIARGLAPEHWNRMVVVDANDEVIETRNCLEATEMSRAHRTEAAKSPAG
jgi:Protein of unknown function (DUF3239)